MVFSIIVLLTKGLQPEMIKSLSLLHPPFLLGLIAGGSVIYWFTGASMQAVVTGAYRAVEFIKANIKLDGVEKASIADSKKVVEICTVYAQKGMINIFFTVLCSTLAFACLESFFFIGYLIAIALSMGCAFSPVLLRLPSRLTESPPDYVTTSAWPQHGTAPPTHGRGCPNSEHQESNL